MGDPTEALAGHSCNSSEAWALESSRVCPNISRQAISRGDEEAGPFVLRPSEMSMLDRKLITSAGYRPPIRPVFIDASRSASWRTGRFE